MSPASSSPILCPFAPQALENRTLIIIFRVDGRKADQRMSRLNKMEGTTYNLWIYPAQPSCEFLTKLCSRVGKDRKCHVISGSYLWTCRAHCMPNVFFESFGHFVPLFRDPETMPYPSTLAGFNTISISRCHDWRVASACEILAVPSDLLSSC